MTSQEFIARVKMYVADYANRHCDKSSLTAPLLPEDVYIVWMCKTLQNHKALASTPWPDGMYYELTYNGDKNELYFDAYKKFENICVEV